VLRNITEQRRSMFRGELHTRNSVYLVKSKLNRIDFLTGSKLQEVLFIRSLYTPCVTFTDSKNR
jgi:hypothetical protein